MSAAALFLKTPSLGKSSVMGVVRRHYADVLAECERARASQMEVVVVDRPASAEASIEMRPDPDGPLRALPPKPAPFREYEAQLHDFISALYRPYEPPV